MRKYLFIFAMLLCWGHTTIATAQTTDTDNLLNIAGLEPDLSGQTTYYLKNVGTGLHMSYGGEWGTHCIETQAAHPIIVEDKGDNLVAIGSLAGYLESNTLWMDSLKSKSNWKLVPVEGYTNQYYLVGDGDRVLTSVGNSAGLLNLQALSKKAMQRWIFTNGDDIRDNKMPKATKDCPFDVTVAIKGAAFDLVDGFSNTDKTPNTIANTSGLTPYYSKWQNYAANSKWIWHCGTRGWDPNEYNYCGITNGDRAAQTITYQMTLPKGTYHFSFEAFYTYMKVVTKQNQTRKNSRWENDGDSWVESYTDNGTLNATIKVNNQTFTLNKNTKLAYDDAAAAAIEFRDHDNYKHDGTFYLSRETTVSIVISKPLTTRTTTENGSASNNKRVVTTTSYPGQVYFDDFTLFYYGTEEIADADISHNAMFASYLNANFEELTAGFCQEAKEAFMENFVDISTIDTRQEYYEALSKFDAATEAAKITQYSIVGANIINPSFETGDWTGWTQEPAQGSWMDTNVQNGGESGKDGDYRFNAWTSIPVTTPITQKVTGLVNGMYELKALVASDPGNVVFLMGNGYHVGKVAEGAGSFVEATLPFLVEDGTATIGAVGGNNGHFYIVGGWYKVDNFRMKYVCDLPHGRLKLALDEAAAVKATLDATGQAALNISNYEAMYNNRSLSGDGFAEVSAIHTALQNAAKAQTSVGADMTWAITNHSFETGNHNGWTTTEGWDSGAREQTHGTYSTIGAEGRYLFNIWMNGVGYPISQTVKNIPNGIYKVSAMVASAQGYKINLTANEMTTTINAGVEISNVAIGEKVGVYPEVICAVNNNILTIKVEGVDNVWYKADNFRLTYLGDEGLTFEESAQTISNYSDVACAKVTVKRTIKPNTWSTFVVPFDIPADFLTDWEVKELSGSTYDEKNGHISLTFEKAEDGIKSGVPYMVRNTTMNENLTAISMENVVVNTQLKNAETDHIKFIGTYTNGYVPTGAFFISNNTFYQAADETNTMKAFRAYLQPKVANARSLTYRTDGDTAIDNSQLTNDNEATVVAIYNLQGVRLDDMQEGVNILQMSNGSVVKVIIK